MKKSRLAIFIASLFCLCAATPAVAAFRDCGQPVSGGALPTVTDAVAVLQTAVGIREDDLCVCDVDDSGAITVSDAHRILKVVVLQEVQLDCPPCTAPPIRRVVEQFLSLQRSGDALGWVESAGAPDPSNSSHYQGVVRYHPGRGESPVFYATLSSNKNFGYLEVFEMASRDTSGERLGSNLDPYPEPPFVLGRPPENDTLQHFWRFNGLGVGPDCDPWAPLPAECDLLLSYEHPSGLSIVDDVLLMSMSSAKDVMPWEFEHVLVLFDLKRPEGHLEPHPIRAVGLPYPAGTLSALDLGWTVLLLGNNSHIRGVEIYMTRTLDPATGEEVFTNDLRDPNIFVASSSCLAWKLPWFCADYAQQLTQGNGIDLNGVVEGWAKGDGAYQGTSLLRQVDGQLYLIAFRNDDAWTPFRKGNNQATLWEMSEVGQDTGKWPVRYGLKALVKLRDFCKADPSRCNFHAAANAYVSPTGELIVYSVPHDDMDIPGTDYVRFAEFQALLPVD